MPRPFSSSARLPSDWPSPSLLSLLSRVSHEAPLPEVLRLAEVLARPAGQDEEQIAQPIDVLERPLADRLDAGQAQDLALGAPAHRPGLVQEAPDPPPTRQNEGFQGRQFLLALVHQA